MQTPPIIPTAASTMPPLWNNVGTFETLLPPPAGISFVQDGFMMTTPPQIWTKEGLQRHTLWIGHEMQLPYPGFDLLRRESTLPPPPVEDQRAIVQTNWDQLVGQLVRSGLAENDREGTTRLKRPIRVQGQGIQSRPLQILDELRWFVSVHGTNPKILGGVIEPSRLGWEDSEPFLWNMVRRLSAAMAAGQATEAEQGLQSGILGALIRRTESRIDSLRPAHSK
jgi:hypothetical protein